MNLNDKLDKIDILKNNFQDNIEKTNGVEFTKGILADFGGFISKHKSMLYGIIGATAINFLASSMAPAMAEQAPTEISQSYKTDGKKSIESEIVEYYKNINMYNSVSNTQFINQDFIKIDNAVLEKIMNIKEGEVIKVENPFWKNGAVEVQAGNSYNNLEAHDNGVRHQVTHENALMRVDSTRQVISINNEFFNNFATRFAGVKNPEEKLALFKFVFYHEAAHASVRQSLELNYDADYDYSVLDRELHSDLSSATLIAVQDKNLDTFNYVIDTMIKGNLLNTETENTHNTSYGLVELKKAFNENPELMQMKTEDISEFAFTILDKMREADFSHTAEVKNFLSGVTVDKKSIVEDIKEGKNLEVINYFAGKVYNKGDTFDIQKLHETNEHRALKLVDKVVNQLSSKMGFEDLSSIVNKMTGHRAGEIKNQEQWKNRMNENVKILTEQANSSPVIDAHLISMFKGKIGIDEMQYDFGKVSQVMNNLKEKQNQEQINKSEFRSYNKLT